jgi:hypothetical protein
MGRLVIALGTDVGVSPSQLALAWDNDEEARSVGKASVDSPAQGMFLADILALVVIPLLVNVGSSAAYALVERLVLKARHPGPDRPELELLEVTAASGDRILVVRVRENSVGRES